jgi:hypothetical protein
MRKARASGLIPLYVYVGKTDIWDLLAFPPAVNFLDIYKDAVNFLDIDKDDLAFLALPAVFLVELLDIEFEDYS